jgi:hypothetical protein
MNLGVLCGPIGAIRGSGRRRQRLPWLARQIEVLAVAQVYPRI